MSNDDRDEYGYNPAMDALLCHLARSYDLVVSEWSEITCLDMLKVFSDFLSEIISDAYVEEEEEGV